MFCRTSSWFNEVLNWNSSVCLTRVLTGVHVLFGTQLECVSNSALISNVCHTLHWARVCVQFGTRLVCVLNWAHISNVCQTLHWARVCVHATRQHIWMYFQLEAELECVYKSALNLSVSNLALHSSVCSCQHSSRVCLSVVLGTQLGVNPSWQWARVCPTRHALMWIRH